MDKPKAKKRNFIVNALFFLAAVAIIFIPAVKVFLISLMMQIGLMSPPTESQTDNGLKPISTEINLKNQNGQIISAAQLKGKILIVNFWATWCPPCRAEMPSLNEMYRHYKDNPKVMLLCVDADGDIAKSVSFMKRNNYDMPVYIPVSELPLELSFETIPSTFIIDDELRVVARHEGAARYDEPSFYNFIDGLVNNIK